VELRPYQQEAREAVHNEWQRGVDKTLLVLPTGTGKTIVFAHVIADRVAQGDRVLVLAHRGELLDQAADKLEKATGLRCATEKAQDTSLDSWYRVTVGSVQTLMRQKRLEQFEQDHYGTIIVDEAHHSISDSYRRILDYFEGAKVLGVTATPDRGDMRNLGVYYESLAYEYTLPKAIKEGYLSPIKARTIPLELDMTGVSSQAGDYKVGDIATALDPYLDQIADAMVTYAGDRKTVVFLPLIATSQKFTHMLQARGIRAAEVNGESENRSEILEDFDAGRYQVLCNSMLLTEGWDCPSVDCIVVLRPTKIRSLYSQMVGRGTRLYPGKDHLLLLDFLWHTANHDLCHPAGLIAGSDEVAKKMTEIIEQSEEPMDIGAVEESAKEQLIIEREEALAESLRAMRRRKNRLVDPLQFAMSIMDEDLANYVPTFGWQAEPVSEKQVALLTKYGIYGEEIENAGKASMLIDRLSKRRDAGLATPKQIRQLEQRGFLHVGTWSMQDASKLIGQIAANNWRTPEWINPPAYRPNKGV
jgi:superfamily II DNA or RNA helicase